MSSISVGRGAYRICPAPPRSRTGIRRESRVSPGTALIRRRLSVVVVDRVAALEELVGLGVAGPDPDLVAVGVDRRGGDDDVGEHQEADRLLAGVFDPVGALGAAGEEGDVVRAELLGALRVAHGRSALQDQQPLLLADLVVVGAVGLAGSELVDAHARVLGPEQLAQGEVPGAETLRIVGVELERWVGDVGALHGLDASSELPIESPVAAKSGKSWRGTGARRGRGGEVGLGGA